MGCEKQERRRRGITADFPSAEPFMASRRGGTEVSIALGFQRVPPAEKFPFVAT